LVAGFASIICVMIFDGRASKDYFNNF